MLRAESKMPKHFRLGPSMNSELRAKPSQTEPFYISEDLALYLLLGPYVQGLGDYLWNPHTQLAAHFSFNCLHHLLINLRNSICFNAETTKFCSYFLGRSWECRNQFVLRLLFRLWQRDLCFYDFWHVQKEKRKILPFHNCVFSQRERLGSFNFWPPAHAKNICTKSN